MLFATRFLLTLLGSLLIAVGWNVAAILYFTNAYFTDYQLSIEARATSPDNEADALQVLLKAQNLDDATLDEYRTVLGDLGAITDGLEFYTQSPPIRSGSLADDTRALQSVGIADKEIDRYTTSRAISTFFGELFSAEVLSIDSPEGVFIRRVLASLAWVNALLFTILWSGAYIFIRRSFTPVQQVIGSVSRLVETREYKTVEYAGRDEFGDLVNAVNRLQKHLELQSRIRSSFLSDLSHELKTPITALRCYLEGIADGVVIPTERDNDFISWEIDRLIRVADRIAEVEQSDATIVSDLHIESVDLLPLTQSIAREYAPRLAESQQIITVSIPRNFSLLVDRDRFTQIIHNLFTNFVRYAGSGTTLHVFMQRVPEEVRIIFSDNGRWVAREESELVREKFYQSDTGRSFTRDGERGMGIGLSVVDRIARLHGASLRIDSDTGAGFTLTIAFARG